MNEIITSMESKNHQDAYQNKLYDDTFDYKLAEELDVEGSLKRIEEAQLDVNPRSKANIPLEYQKLSSYGFGRSQDDRVRIETVDKRSSIEFPRLDRLQKVDLIEKLGKSRKRKKHTSQSLEGIRSKSRMEPTMSHTAKKFDTNANLLSSSLNFGVQNKRSKSQLSYTAEVGKLISHKEGSHSSNSRLHPLNSTENVKPSQVSEFFKVNRKLFMKSDDSSKKFTSTIRQKNSFSHTKLPQSHFTPSRVDNFRPLNTFITDGIASDIIPSLDYEKPPLLKLLEDHLYEQLSQAYDDSDYVNTFKECFSILGQHFSTYSTYLEDVSQNYEQCYKLLKERVNVQRMKDLTTNSQGNIDDEVKINTHLYSLHVAQKEEALEKENAKLKQQLSESETKVVLYKRQYQDLLTKYEAKKEKAMAVRDDAHYLQYSLRSAVENVMIPMKDEIMIAEQTYEDMKRMEERTNQNLKDVVTLRESLVHEEEYLDELAKQKELLAQSDALLQKIKFLRVANKRLRSQIQNMQGKAINREDISEKLILLQHAVTPRPDWSDYAPQYQEEWEGLSSHEIVEWLSMHYYRLKEQVDSNNKMIEGNKKTLQFLDSEIGEEERNHQKYFYGLGNSDIVPPYLRFTGRLRKKNISKRDCELILEELWEERKKEIKKAWDNGLPVINFQDFFSEFIKNKYGMLRSVRAEWIYNLTWACDRYIEDPDCELFLRILRGEISEDAYKEQFEMFERIHEAIMKADTNNKGVLKKKQLMKVIKKFFKTKTPERLKRLRQQLDQFDKKKSVHYKKLFEETRDKTQSDFIEELRRQFLAEVIEYTEEVVAAIKNRVPEGEKLISLNDIVEAFRSIDPLKPKKEIDRLIQSCLDTDPFGGSHSKIVPPGQTMERGAIPDESFMVQLDLFINRLRTGKLLKRTTPKSGVEKAIRKKKIGTKSSIYSTSPKIVAEKDESSSKSLSHTGSDNSFKDILDGIEKRHHKSFANLSQIEGLQI